LLERTKSAAVLSAFQVTLETLTAIPARFTSNLAFVLSTALLNLTSKVLELIART
jgi:hypothetical protein